MNNPKDFIIKSDATILAAMAQIDHAAKGIIFIIDQRTERLIGSLSDGDIRRYMLKGKSLSENVQEAMNKKPFSLFWGQENDNVISEILLDKKFKAIPLINDSGQIERIYFEGQEPFIKKRQDLNVPVIIMAGGKGTRLAPYTDILPKPLIPIAGKTIVEHIMDQFIEVGCSQFEMIVNYRKNLIKAFFQDEDNPYQVNFTDEIQFQGTAGGLSLIKDKVNETFFMTNCDILVQCDFEELLNFHRKNNNILTMVGAEMSLTVPYGTIIADSNGKVNDFTEKPSFNFISNTGLYVIEPNFLKLIPDDTFIHITEIIKNCITQNLNIGVYKVPQDNWLDMGEHDALQKMTKRLKNNKW